MSQISLSRPSAKIPDMGNFMSVSTSQPSKTRWIERSSGYAPMTTENLPTATTTIPRAATRTKMIETEIELPEVTRRVIVEVAGVAVEEVAGVAAEAVVATVSKER